MSKRLVVCCDGTWNIPDQKCPTNVTKIALALASEDARGVQQRVFYHRGVGTNRRERVRGGAFGAGLSRNVIDAYRFLVKNYEPGDELYFFGFSRGAFTARSTVGLLRNAGVLRPEHEDRIAEAYALYRSRTDTKTPRGREATLFRRSYSHEPDVKFIGVWDTVGALGIPVSGSRLIARVNRRWGFHNTDLSTKVGGAFQALAIDEQRRPFKPALWRVQKDAPATQVVEQAWFSGVHSDVGGGYPDHSLSDIALLWMVERARKFDLAFVADAFAHQVPSEGSEDDVRACTWVAPNPLGTLNRSRKGFYRLTTPWHRKPLFAEVPKEGEDTDPGGNGEYVASSAVRRRRAMADYQPREFLNYLKDDYTTPVPRINAPSASRSEIPSLKQAR